MFKIVSENSIHALFLFLGLFLKISPLGAPAERGGRDIASYIDTIYFTKDPTEISQKKGRPRSTRPNP